MSEELKNIPVSFTPAYHPPATKQKVAEMLQGHNGQPNYSNEQKMMLRCNAENNTAMMVKAYAQLLSANSQTVPLKEAEIRLLLDSYRKAAHAEISKGLGLEGHK